MRQANMKYFDSRGTEVGIRSIAIAPLHCTAPVGKRARANDRITVLEGHLVMTGQLPVTMHGDQSGVYKERSTEKAV